MSLQYIILDEIVLVVRFLDRKIRRKRMQKRKSGQTELLRF